MPKEKKWLDIRDFLWGVNGIIVLLTLLSYPMFQHARYVNGFTFILSLALALQVSWGLSKRKPVADPFVVILLYYVMIYYSLRVVTLAVFDTSDVFRRFPYVPQDTNYALAFVMACNACMLCGFGLMRKSLSLPGYTLIGWESNAQDFERYLHSLILILFISVIGYVSGTFDWLSEQFRALEVLIFFLRPTSLFILVGAYLAVFYQKVPRRYFIVYFSLCLLSGLVLTIRGSRAQIIYFFEMFALVLIANELFRIRWKWISRGLMCAPLMLVVLVVTFNFATLQRGGIGKDSGRLEVVMNNLYGAITNGHGVNYFKDNVAHILSRIGYLDMSAEIIAHEPQYRSSFLSSYYAKSLIDNLLTPGFDLYDTPKISYSLIFKHQNLNQGVPSKTYLLENKIYHSDQLGLYGEVYALFGWYSLPIMILFSYLLKWVYYNLWVSGNRYEEVVKRVVVATLFVSIINSFGFDWIVVQIFPFVFTAGFLILYLRRVASQKSHEASF